MLGNESNKKIEEGLKKRGLGYYNSFGCNRASSGSSITDSTSEGFLGF